MAVGQRVRPYFREWSAELPVEVDESFVSLQDLLLIWRTAGSRYGIGDMRPIFGRFNGVLKGVER